MPTPQSIATSAQFRPRLGYVVADDPTLSVPHSQINSALTQRVYRVVESDTLGDVARKLYGANVPQTRAKIMQQGFYPGSLIQF